jgi:hypothetical protein
VAILYIKANMVSVYLFVCFQLQIGAGQGGRGRARQGRVDTRPLFSVIGQGRAGQQGQGRATGADTRSLFSVTDRQLWLLLSAANLSSSWQGRLHLHFQAVIF